MVANKRILPVFETPYFGTLGTRRTAMPVVAEGPIPTRRMGQIPTRRLSPTQNEDGPVPTRLFKEGPPRVQRQFISVAESNRRNAPEDPDAICYAEPDRCSAAFLKRQLFSSGHSSGTSAAQSSSYQNSYGNHYNSDYGGVGMGYGRYPYRSSFYGDNPYIDSPLGSNPYMGYSYMRRSAPFTDWQPMRSHDIPHPNLGPGLKQKIQQEIQRWRPNIQQLGNSLMSPNQQEPNMNSFDRREPNIDPPDQSELRFESDMSPTAPSNPSPDEAPVLTEEARHKLEDRFAPSKHIHKLGSFDAEFRGTPFEPPNYDYDQYFLGRRNKEPSLDIKKNTANTKEEESSCEAGSECAASRMRLHETLLKSDAKRRQLYGLGGFGKQSSYGSSSGQSASYSNSYANANNVMGRPTYGQYSGMGMGMPMRGMGGMYFRRSGNSIADDSGCENGDCDGQPTN